MIKETELRVGNIVYCKGIIDKVLTVGNNDFYTEKHYHGIINEDLNPIPLTEDILLKCGFGKENYSMMCHIYSNGKFEIQNNFTIYFQSKWIKLECLHQLQNLYFALTGEELTINL